jgi:hypothetical protein
MCWLPKSDPLSKTPLASQMVWWDGGMMLFITVTLDYLNRTAEENDLSRSLPICKSNSRYLGLRRIE